MALLSWLYLGLGVLWVQCLVDLSVIAISLLDSLLAFQERLVEFTDVLRLLVTKVLLVDINLFLNCVAQSLGAFKVISIFVVIVGLFELV